MAEPAPRAACGATAPATRRSSGPPPPSSRSSGSARARRPSPPTPSPRSSGRRPAARRCRPTCAAFMEPRLGADLGDVRVHADESAASLSNHLSARAFTYRNHVFFARDQYQPGTAEGRHLLAHELTHTIQQGATVQRAEQRAPEVQRAAGADPGDHVRLAARRPAAGRAGRARLLRRQGVLHPRLPDADADPRVQPDQHAQHRPDRGQLPAGADRADPGRRADHPGARQPRRDQQGRRVGRAEGRRRSATSAG